MSKAGKKNRMDLMDLVHRPDEAAPWARGYKLPWSNLAFSKRMLEEHLNQEHDAASRRIEKIDGQVRWIHTRLLNRRKTKVLDLCCGPGLYAHRLTQLGHKVVGIDYAPASIRFARQEAKRQKLDCEFRQGDVRKTPFRRGFGLALMLFGEFNTFSPQEANDILRKIHDALKSQGILLLECHTFKAVMDEGRAGSDWDTAETGLFSERPYLWLKESSLDEDQHVATSRYYVVDATTGRVERFASTLQGYSDDEYHSLLAQNRFGYIRFRAGMTRNTAEAEPGLQVIVARKLEKEPARKSR